MWDWLLTVDLGKKIGMVQRTDKGWKVRDYFVAMEKVAQELYHKPKPPTASKRTWIIRLYRTKMCHIKNGGEFRLNTLLPPPWPKRCV